MHLLSMFLRENLLLICSFQESKTLRRWLNIATGSALAFITIVGISRANPETLKAQPFLLDGSNGVRWHGEKGTAKKSNKCLEGKCVSYNRFLTARTLESLVILRMTLVSSKIFIKKIPRNLYFIGCRMLVRIARYYELRGTLVQRYFVRILG